MIVRTLELSRNNTASGTMFGVKDIEARVRRLDELAKGLAREVVLWRGGNDPLLYLERRAYVNALQDALEASEKARIVLSQALDRIAAGGGVSAAKAEAES